VQGRQLTAAEVDEMHARKTGALIGMRNSCVILDDDHTCKQWDRLLEPTRTFERGRVEKRGQGTDKQGNAAGLDIGL
jgi:hypothetical protein